MSAELEFDSRLEIAHVLCMDIVGYSKLPIDQQSEALRQLNQIVRGTEQFGAAEEAGKLIRLPTGDGMALAFFTSPDAPVRCAIEIGRALKAHRQVHLRMGIDSGPVDRVADVNERSNVAGTGINMAQRVMDCGDAGHILLSQRVAGDLAQYSKWKAQLCDLGEIAVKHGVRIRVVNFVDGEIGNSALPEKIQRLRLLQSRAVRRRIIAWSLGAIALAATVGAAFWMQSHRMANTHTMPIDKSIAVLPFASLSKDDENAFFAGGVQDEILTNLARIADLKVISRTSVMPYKPGAERNVREIAKTLGVAHILEGSVQRAAGRVRVTAQLIDARTDTHIWAEHYDRELADVFAIQSEIAQHIVDQLRARLSPTEQTSIVSQPTQDLQAYDLYLRAKELVHNRDPREDWGTDEKVHQALALLEQAVVRDPQFALAYSRIISVNLMLYWTDEKPPVYRERAAAALQKAIQFAPNAGETHVAQATFYYYAELDYDHALEQLEIAARQLPNDVEVLTLSARIERRLGRWTEAVRHFAKAVELDPRDVSARASACVTLIMMRRYREAIETAERALADFPDSAVTFRLRKGEAALHAGDLKTARAALEAIPLSDRNDTDVFWFWYSIAMSERNFEDARRAVASRAGFPNHDALAPDALFEGSVARAEGNLERARSAFVESRKASEALLRDHPTDEWYLGQAAEADAALGRRQEALSEIEKALEVGNDPLKRPGILTSQAVVYCRLGVRESALQKLEDVARMPNGIDYGSLRFDPEWDAVRDDPRFQMLIANLKPRDL